MSIVWSLNPIVMFMNICGIPTLFCKQEKAKSCSHRLMGYIWPIISLICLSLNVLFQSYNFLGISIHPIFCKNRTLENDKYRATYEQTLQSTPLQVQILFQDITKLGVVTGIPLVFSFQFYFTERFKKMWSSIREIDGQLAQRHKSFYLKCRRCCLCLIAFFLMELALYVSYREMVGQIPISVEYDFRKLLDIGITTLCNLSHFWSKYPEGIYSYKKKIPPALMKQVVSYGTGIWVQSSSVAVWGLFCALVMLTSFLAEEMDERAKKAAQHSAKPGVLLPSFNLDGWLKEFHELHVMAERIKDFFSPMLALTVFQCFVEFSDRAYLLFQYTPKLKYIPWKTFLAVILGTLILSVRLGIIVTVCRRFHDKMKNLQYSLKRLPSFMFTSIQERIQRENVNLQVSAQLEVKITALDMFDIDGPLLLTLLGVSITYGLVLNTACNRFYGVE